MHAVLHFIGKVLWYIPWGIGVATIIAVFCNNLGDSDSNDDYEGDNDDYEGE